MHMSRSNRFVVPLSLAAVYVIWGSTYFGLRIALESWPPMMLAGVRFTFAGALLYVVLRARGAEAPTLAQWGRVAVVAAVLLVCGHGGVVYAQQWVDSGIAAVMTSTVPLWAALFAGFLGRGWPASRERVGLVLGFSGAALLALGGPLGVHGPGALVLVAAPAMWALGSLLGQRWDVPRGLLGSATTMLAAGPLFFLLALVRGERFTEVPSLRSTLALAYLAVFGSIVAFSAYQILLARVRASVATSYAYVNPVIALGLGATFAEEELGAVELVAIAVTLAGVVLLTWRTSKPLPKDVSSLAVGAPEAAPIRRPHVPSKSPLLARPSAGRLSIEPERAPSDDPAPAIGRALGGR
ncbi:MAG: drug/metabolite exporter YedA [Deltaproteobacteria bacterium]|nr:drug/metabolite exporter YedA [Deltaproteobacteria bacterium]